VSRWRSPQIAAERAAKEAAKLRKEKRRGWLLLVCWAVVSLGLTVGDYFWMRHRARQQHERLHHLQGTNNSTLQTNQTGSSLPERKP
jgi:uncharacterized protein HemX